MRTLQNTPKWKKGKQDLAFLKLVGEAELGIVAQRLKMSETAVRSKLFRLRRDIAFYVWFVNNVRSLQSHNPRIRKMTTSGQVKHEEVNEDEDI